MAVRKFTTKRDVLHIHVALDGELRRCVESMASGLGVSGAEALRRLIRAEADKRKPAAQAVAS